VEVLETQNHNSGWFFVCVCNDYKHGDGSIEFLKM